MDLRKVNPLTDLSDRKLAFAFEKNFARWCELVDPNVSQVEKENRCLWIYDSIANGSSSMHCFRTTSKELDAYLQKVIRHCDSREVGINAYFASHAKPRNSVEVLAENGFQLLQRFDILACDLKKLNSSIKRSSQVKTASQNSNGNRVDLDKLEIVEVPDLSIFNAKFPHPLAGAINTAERRAWRSMIQYKLDQNRAAHLIAYHNGSAVASAIVFFHAGVAGIYDVGTTKKYRRQGIGTKISLAALTLARSAGFHASTLIASAKGLLIYRKFDFYSVGKMSYLYRDATGQKK